MALVILGLAVKPVRSQHLLDLLRGEHTDLPGVLPCGAPMPGSVARSWIAASKRKGMWMGGVPPLGYRVEDRKLLVIDSEAELGHRGRTGDGPWHGPSAQPECREPMPKVSPSLQAVCATAEAKCVDADPTVNAGGYSPMTRDL